MARGPTGWTIAHVHIAFAEDYSDLPRNCRLFQAVEKLGAVKRGSWGAAPFAGFEPRDGEIVVDPQLQQRLPATPTSRRCCASAASSGSP